MAVLFSTVVDFFKEEPKLVDRGQNARNSNHVEACDLKKNTGGSGHIVRATVHASMKDRRYKVEMLIDNYLVTGASCECPRGKVRCHHMASALLVAADKFSKTDVACTWSKPKGPTKKQQTANTTDDLWPTDVARGFSLNRAPDAEDYRWLLETAKGVNPEIGIVWLLSEEPPEDHHKYSMEYVLERFRGARLEVFLDKMRLSEDIITEIALQTTGQSSNPLWMLHRQYRITASNFGLVLKGIHRNKFCKSLFTTLLGGYAGLTGAAIGWGKDHESTAISAYEATAKVDVVQTGIWISTDGALGSSPDGLVGDDGLVEVKCPYKHKDASISEAIASDKNFCLAEDGGVFVLKTGHNYYHQVQGQIYLTNRSWCDFVVWTCVDVKIVRIQKDLEWGVNLQLMKEFYVKELVPKFKETVTLAATM